LNSILFETASNGCASPKLESVTIKSLVSASFLWNAFHLAKTPTILPRALALCQYLILNFIAIIAYQANAFK
jgi:hypothetical protein